LKIVLNGLISATNNNKEQFGSGNKLWLEIQY
jgi:hypothetical protein